MRVQHPAPDKIFCCYDRPDTDEGAVISVCNTEKQARREARLYESQRLPYGFWYEHYKVGVSKDGVPHYEGEIERFDIGAKNDQR